MHEMETDRDRLREVHYEDLAHAVMAAEKSQELQAASWVPRRSDGVCCSLGASLQAQELPPQRRAERTDSPSRYLFVLFMPPKD